MGVCSQLLAQKKPDRLYFLFASPGGQVTAGVVLHTFLKSLPVKITMHNTGAIDSIGNTIFVAGEQRFATAHSSFLFHGVSMNFGQGASLGSNMLQEKLSSIRADEAKIAGILSSRTKLSEDEVRQLFVQGESKDPIFALDKGIIDEVKEVAIPHGAEVLTVNFQ
jgi:ATP-dependent protease ClpP protease subunit